MQQDAWRRKIPFTDGYAIYGLTTAFFTKEEPETFYIGVTRNVEKRVREHIQQPFLPSSSQKLSRWLNTFDSSEVNKLLKDEIIRSSIHSGFEIGHVVYESGSVETLKPDKNMSLAEIYCFEGKKGFIPYEREKRHILDGFQKGLCLVNIERFYESTIKALQRQQKLDVLSTSLESNYWNPIITAFLKDIG